MRTLRILALAGLAAAELTVPGATVAGAQYYEERPRRRYEIEEGYERPAPRAAAGLNCDAVQQGLSGPQPFSCPLPGPRPLGVRCFCNLPVASFSPPQTAVGRVVP